MINISEEQVKVFCDQRFDVMAATALKHVHTHYPLEAARLEPQELREVIREGLG